MNLRQKVTKAKRELRSINKEETRRKRLGYDTTGTSNTLEMVQYFQHKHRLEDIVSLKNKKYRHERWNENIKINGNKLTYIAMYVEFTKIGELFYPNGQVLTHKEIDEFLSSEEIKNKMYQLGMEASQREPEKQFKKNSHIDYWIAISDMRTKNKILKTQKLFYQFYGSDLIYEYEPSDKPSK